MFSFNHNLVHNTESRNIEKIYVTRKNLYNEIKGEIENKKYEEVKFSKSWISNRWLALLADCGITVITTYIYLPIAIFVSYTIIASCFIEELDCIYKGIKFLASKIFYFN